VFVFVIAPARFPLSRSRRTRQLSAVRVPLPIAILLAVAVGGGVWWVGTRHHDFLQEPADSRVKMIRAQAGLALPAAEPPANGAAQPAGTAQPAAPPAESPAAPAMDPGDLNAPPTLALYREGASMNAQGLLELSSALESKGEIQRALLAAERVIDSSKPDDGQLRTAIHSIRRLRPQVPDWNTEPAISFPVTLHAGTGESTAFRVEPLLRELATEIERASSGILKVTATVTRGRDIPADIGPPLVAIWFAEPADGTHSTEVFSFIVPSPETLRDDLARSVLQLLRGHIGRTTFLRIPESEVDAANPIARLPTHVTRLVWLELGSRLNLANE
jgi:hypothetical protein